MNAARAPGHDVTGSAVPAGSHSRNRYRGREYGPRASGFTPRAGPEAPPTRPAERPDAQGPGTGTRRRGRGRAHPSERTRPRPGRHQTVGAAPFTRRGTPSGLSSRSSRGSSDCGTDWKDTGRRKRRIAVVPTDVCRGAVVAG